MKFQLYGVRSYRLGSEAANGFEPSGNLIEHKNGLESENKNKKRRRADSFCAPKVTFVVGHTQMAANPTAQISQTAINQLVGPVPLPAGDNSPR